MLLNREDACDHAAESKGGGCPNLHATAMPLVLQVYPLQLPVEQTAKWEVRGVQSASEFLFVMRLTSVEGGVCSSAELFDRVGCVRRRR
jgi:hypothetical protein